jgi:hypothetical protein
MKRGYAAQLAKGSPHFRFEKDFNFYLNSSRAASSGEFKFKNFSHHKTRHIESTRFPVTPG